jgi:hypothetical protein
MQFRKTKTFGGLRFSLSKKGIGVSVGAGPLRVGVGADGKVRRTVRAPGTGIYDTKVIGSVRPAKTAAKRPQVVVAAPEAPLCTESQREYLAGVLRARTVEVVELADFDGITVFEAEHVLHRLGVDPAELYRDGRAPGGEQAPWAARFSV